MPLVQLGWRVLTPIWKDIGNLSLQLKLFLYSLSCSFYFRLIYYYYRIDNFDIKIFVVSHLDFELWYFLTK